MDNMATREGLAAVCRTMPWNITQDTRVWLGDLAPPPWDPAQRDAGKWRQDDDGRWWGPGEW